MRGRRDSDAQPMRDDLFGGAFSGFSRLATEVTFNAKLVIQLY